MELYLSDKLSQEVDPTAHKKHVRELGRLSEFMARRGKFFPHEIGLADLTEFRAGWVKHYASSLTRSKVQERLRGFLRYAFNAKMIEYPTVVSYQSHGTADTATNRHSICKVVGSHPDRV